MSEYTKKSKYFNEHIKKYQTLLFLPCRKLEFKEANRKCLLPADYIGMEKICNNCIQKYRDVFLKHGGYSFNTAKIATGKEIKFKEEYDNE